MDREDSPPLAWLQLVQAVSSCGRQLRRALAEVATPHGLSDTECLILWACGEANVAGRGQHLLATLVGVSPAQLSGLVERLGERGWLAGRRPLHDRRRQYWQTTPAGATLLAQVVADLARSSTQLAEALSEAERGALQSELERLATAATDGTTTRQEAA